MNTNFNLEDYKDVVKSILQALGGKCLIESLISEFDCVHSDVNLVSIASKHGMSVEIFLQTLMPDVVTLRKLGDGFVVEKISDNDSKHLENVFMNEKIEKQQTQVKSNSFYGRSYSSL